MDPCPDCKAHGEMATNKDLAERPKTKTMLTLLGTFVTITIIVLGASFAISSGQISDVKKAQVKTEEKAQAKNKEIEKKVDAIKDSINKMHVNLIREIQSIKER